MLPGAGCEYWKKTGGCSMCGFNNATQKYSHGFLFPTLIFWLMYKLARRTITTASELTIFNGGSFFNDREIPPRFKKWLYQEVAKDPLIGHLTVESRCEYITEEAAGSATQSLGGKKMTIAVGLESQDDYVRNVLIKKGLKKTVFEQKVALAHKVGATVSAYVFLKPLGLSEEGALKETVKTIQYALAVGVDKIDLSCAFVQENTPMARAYYEGKFSPPSLWTILRIIKLVQENNWPVSIGGFTDEPPPIAIPANCSNCSPQIYEAIEQFRQTNTLGDIPQCVCRSSFHATR